MNPGVDNNGNKVQVNQVNHQGFEPVRPKLLTAKVNAAVTEHVGLEGINEIHIDFGEDYIPIKEKSPVQISLEEHVDKISTAQAINALESVENMISHKKAYNAVSSWSLGTMWHWSQMGDFSMENLEMTRDVLNKKIASSAEV